MRRLSILLVLPLVAAALLVACSGNKSKTSTATASPGATRPAVVGATAVPQVSGPASGTPRAGAGQTPSPRNTPVTQPSAACAAQSAGPQAAAVQAQPSPEPPFVPGPQPVRPAVD